MIEKVLVLPTKLLVLKEEIKETKSMGGLILPQSRQAPPNISGFVAKVGAGTETVPMNVAVEDSVFFYQRGAQPVVISDIEYLLLDVRDILFWIPA